MCQEGNHMFFEVIWRTLSGIDNSHIFFLLSRKFLSLQSFRDSMRVMISPLGSTSSSRFLSALDPIRTYLHMTVLIYYMSHLCQRVSEQLSLYILRDKKSLCLNGAPLSFSLPSSFFQSTPFLMESRSLKTISESSWPIYLSI